MTGEAEAGFWASKSMPLKLPRTAMWCTKAYGETRRIDWHVVPLRVGRRSTPRAHASVAVGSIYPASPAEVQTSTAR